MVFTSRHFKLHQLAEGVFAAVAENGGHAICNAGLIDLGGQILVFDTFLTPQAAADLRQFAVEQFAQPPRLVINSHYHNDHIWGNQVFAAEAQIVSSASTRELIATSGVEEFQWYSANSAKRLAALQEEFQLTSDEQKKQELLLWMGEYGGLVEALPALTVCLPTITFTGRLVIHGEQRSAELITFEGGHTGSDTVLHLPQDGIVFMSDLLFTDFHPYLADGDPWALMNALREISQLGAAAFIPGHGPIGDIEDVKLLIDYIEECIGTARGLVDAGNANEDRIKALPVPERFRRWSLAQFYASNIRFLCDRLSTAAGDV